MVGVVNTIQNIGVCIALLSGCMMIANIIVGIRRNTRPSLRIAQLALAASAVGYVMVTWR